MEEGTARARDMGVSFFEDTPFLEGNQKRSTDPPPENDKPIVVGAMAPGPMIKDMFNAMPMCLPNRRCLSRYPSDTDCLEESMVLVCIQHAGMVWHQCLQKLGA